MPGEPVPKTGFQACTASRVNIQLTRHPTGDGDLIYIFPLLIQYDVK